MTYEANLSASTDTVENIDDLLFEEKEDDDILEENNSMFTIDENEDVLDTPLKKEREKSFDDEDIADQPLRVDSYLPVNHQSTVPLIRTINIGDELSDINKQLAFISDIIGWIKQQIDRIRPQLRRDNELRSNDQDTFNAILVSLRKLLLDASSTKSLCISAPKTTKKTEKILDKDPNEEADNDSNAINNGGGDKTDKSPSPSLVNGDLNTSSYLRRTIEIVRDLTDECCTSNKVHCVQLFKSILADVASNPLTHHLVIKLLEVFMDRISNQQYKLEGWM